jgi:ABC-type Fe3+-hydroxamate transport system substrate-binding protein
MKLKFLAILSLAAFLLLSGCGGNKDNTNANTNVNKTTVGTPTPVAKTNETAAVDNTLKTKTEDALKKKGFNDVTVDATTTPATLRGSVPKGKLAEAVQTAQEAAGKPFKNEITEK